MSLLAEYADPEGGSGFVLRDIYHESATDLLQGGILNFCCCGRPEDNLSYILGGLALIEERGPDDHDAWKAWWEDHKARELEHFGSQRAAYFFYYWCAQDGIDLTEHGGSVPGWLTERGQQLLALLREWGALPKEGA